MAATQLSANALHLAFNLHNSNPQTQTVDVAVTNNINFDGNESAPVWALPGGAGYVISSPRFAITWA
jgi:hypothetical protein